MVTGKPAWGKGCDGVTDKKGIGGKNNYGEDMNAAEVIKRLESEKATTFVM